MVLWILVSSCYITWLSIIKTSAKVYMHLEKPYKRWCLEQLDEDCPSDLATVAILRHMFQVTFYTFLYLILYYIPGSITNSVT